MSRSFPFPVSPDRIRALGLLPENVVHAAAMCAKLRPQVAPAWLLLVASLFFSVGCNGAFWHALVATGVSADASGWRIVASLFVAMTALHMALLCVLCTGIDA